MFVWTRHFAVLALLLAVIHAPSADAMKVLPPATKDASSAAVRRIVVRSNAWVLLPDAPFQDVVVITRKGSGYRLAGLSYDQGQAKTYSVIVGIDKINRLLNALKAPLQPRFSFKCLGKEGPVALHKLQASIQEDLAGSSGADYSVSQKAVLASILDNPGRIEAAISASSVRTHTDDAPSLSVDVTLENGDSIEAKSISQHLFMLPWDIKNRGRTFNPAIAKALRSLLPGGFGARDRLAFDQVSLSEMFYSGMGKQLGEAGAEDEAGHVIPVLRAAFTLKAFTMAGSLLDTTFRPGAPRDLIAELAMPGTPSNLSMRFRITLVGGRANNLDIEIARATALFKRVAAIPFLTAQMRIHPKDTYTINYWYGTSLHPDALTLGGDEIGGFGRYMRSVKKIELDKQQLDDAALVNQDGKQTLEWVVLPDRRVVLWREFSPQDFAANLKSCGMTSDSDDSMADAYHCIGFVFVPSGKVIPPLLHDVKSGAMRQAPVSGWG